MAVYKVPQDVEADDKLIGPFTFKQFVFIILMIGFLYMTYLAWRTNPVFTPIPLFPALFFAILGLWPRKDQPIEVYLMAIVRFWLKPRKRLWNQEGMVEHVIINAPKTEVHQYSDGLSRTEVQSRLKNLADSLDSRGWTAKNVEVQDVTRSLESQRATTDRLVMPQVLYPATPDPIDIHQSDDILDVAHNPVAQNFDALAAKATQAAKDEAISHMHQAEDVDGDVKYNPYPEMQQTKIKPLSEQNDPSPSPPPPAPAPADEPPAQAPTTTDEPPAEPAVTEQPSAAILNLAQNSDLNVSTIARQAEEQMHDVHDDETVQLH